MKPKSSKFVGELFTNGNIETYRLSVQQRGHLLHLLDAIGHHYSSAQGLAPYLLTHCS